MKSRIVLLLTATILFSCSSTQKKSTTENERGLVTSKIISLTDTHWRLIELMGKPVPAADGGHREMYLILKKTDSVAFGNSGCNGFTGNYNLQQEALRISFSKMASTTMACMDMEKEKLFLDMLQMADNYTVLENKLSLNKARMAPLAKFEAVQGK